MQISQLKRGYSGVEASVESVCGLGCERVNRILLEGLEGRVPAELSHLDSEERAAVLEELQAIMSVYDGNCSH